MVARLARLYVVAIVAALASRALACDQGSDASIASLSVTSADPLTPAVGDTVTLTVRAVMTDGTSIDVSDRAGCSLVAKSPPGTLSGLVFTATRSGTTDVACTFHGASGSIGITVPGALHVTAAQVQTGKVDVNTKIEISAIVFALDPDGRYTNFWAQDPGGGPSSGIYFRDVRKLAPADAGPPDPRPVAENDAVTVTGSYIERQGRSVISWETVTKTGTDTPHADVVPIASVDPGTWESCFIEVQNVVVTNPRVDSYTWQVGDAANPGGAPLLVETLLFPSTPATGDKYAAIRGPLYVSALNDAGALEVALAPRRAEDLAK
jgi:hypothetical protein